MMTDVSRRAFTVSLSLAALAGLGLRPGPSSAANTPLDLTWSELMPKDIAITRALEGIIQHDQIPLSQAGQEEPNDPWVFSEVVEELNGKNVKLAGYGLPLDFNGETSKEMLLVPYFGACIHVPPPPPNQIVYVTSEEGFRFGGLFDPIEVTGLMNTHVIRTDLADIGYQIVAEKIEPYRL